MLEDYVCPNCKAIMLDIIHTDLRTYTAPKSCNGITGVSVGWCQECGTIQQSTYGNTKSKDWIQVPTIAKKGRKS